MANYEIPEYVIKRLRYFDNQFLKEQDFIDEQHYHIDRQRRHNRLLHSPGVAEGLDVKKVGDIHIQVDPGTAIDGQGRQILLLSNRRVEVKDKKNNNNLFQQGQLVYLVIFYSQQESDEASAGGSEKTRWEESPGIECYEEKNVPADDNIFLRLAQLKIGEGGRVDEIDIKIRKMAGGKSGVTQDSIDETLLKQTVRDKLVNLGNNHDHTGGNGAPIKHGFLEKDDGSNPHKTTADDVEALSLTKGGTVRGPVKITTIDGKSKLEVRTENEGVYENSDSRISDTGSVFVLNTKQKSYALVAKITDTDLAMPNSTPIPPAAVVAIAGFDNANAIYATAKTGNHALYVEGTAKITGGVNPGHILDTFINASGQPLRTGDVVKLKGTPVTRFRGMQNKVPIAEITLADRENDTLVIGIVDCEAIPESGAPDTRVDPKDPSFIEDGKELYLVTLGVFAHCKVDATEATIEVGDLLTTSKNPGYAKKATEPKIGSIIGKALAPLKQGTGEISVFVNIQ